MSETQWLTPEQQRVWRGLLGVQVRLLSRLDEELQARHGTSLADYEVLVHLSEAPDHRLRMTELAQKLCISPSGLTRRVIGLVKTGLVRRERCSDDRRGTYAVLTGAGATKIRQAAPTHVEGVRRYLFHGIGSDDLRSIRLTLARIDDRLALGSLGRQQAAGTAGRG